MTPETVIGQARHIAGAGFFSCNCLENGRGLVLNNNLAVKMPATVTAFLWRR
jgi:hypothetical protein